MYETSFRVSKSLSMGSFSLINKNFWNIKSDFQNFSLYDDNGNFI